MDVYKVLLSTAALVGEENWGITVFKHNEKGTNELVVPHTHDFFTVFFVERGKGYHNIDFERHDVHDYQVFFLRPQQVHNWKLDCKTTGYQLIFSTAFLNYFSVLNLHPFYKFGAASVLNLDKKEFEFYRKRLHQLEQDLTFSTALDQEITLLQFHLVLKYLHRTYLRHYESTTSLVVDPRVLKFEELLEKHFREENYVNYYAAKMQITPNYLNIKCKQALGKTASTLIQERVLLESKRMLITSNASIKEIAFLMSFSDTSYFNNFFKKHTKLTPGEFRVNYKYLPF